MYLFNSLVGTLLMNALHGDACAGVSVCFIEVSWSVRWYWLPFPCPCVCVCFAFALLVVLPPFCLAVVDVGLLQSVCVAGFCRPNSPPWGASVGGFLAFWCFNLQFTIYNLQFTRVWDIDMPFEDFCSTGFQ